MVDVAGAIDVGRRSSVDTRGGWRAPDRRRLLQLALATAWLFDFLLQLQPFMFSREFGDRMLGANAVGNPSGLAHSITWAGRTIGDHAMVANAIFAVIQLLIALGIAWRPTVKIALGASVVWALAVWWAGEGFGGTISGSADPLSGAPGAVLLYAVLAVLLWPREREGADRSFVAGCPLGSTFARGVWFALWGGLACFGVLGVNRSAQGLHDIVNSMAVGEPRWIASLDHGAAAFVAQRGLEVSVAMSVLLAFVAASVFLPPVLSKIGLGLAVLLALTIWVLGENFGQLFSGGTATDPSTGPLLVILAAAYWRPRLAVAGAPVRDRARKPAVGLRGETAEEPVHLAQRALP